MPSPPRRVSRIQEIITRAGLVDELQVRSAQSHIEKWGGNFASVVVQLGFVDEEAMTQVIGAGLQMQVMHLGTVPHDATALSRLDERFCEQHLVFPVSLRDRVLQLAMADPTQLQIIDEVKARSGARVQPMLTSASEITAAISRHYRKIDLAPITDNRARMAFKTEVKHSGQVTSRIAALQLSSATSMLDDILGDEAFQFGEAELARLKGALNAQEKAGQIIQAVRSLLAEKGFR